MFNTIDEVYNYLYTQKKLAKRENLDRIKFAKEKLNIKINYKIIHIAGTNGKGSTACMIKSMLMLKNLHIGLFVSPFVISFNERIEVNDRYISDSEIMYYSNKLYEFNEWYKKEYNDVIPFFELTLLMALMYFEDRNIDIAVIECGLGGLLDSTNFLDTNLAIITNIGYDHMAQLGDTLEKIAYHKLGIVKNNMNAITAVDDSLMYLFNEHAKNIGANIKNICSDVSDIYVDNYTHFKYKGIEYKTNLLGDYQAYNAALAIEAINYFGGLEYDLIDYALSNIFWPGRMEIIKKDPLVIIDGAHNIHAISALVNYLSKNYNNKFNVIFSALIDKDYKNMIKVLDNIALKYYFTKIEDLRKTDISLYNNLTDINYSLYDDYKEAIKDSINDNNPILITGSLHFISEIRKYLKGE